MSTDPTGVIAQIVELLRLHPEGLTSGEIREKLGIAANEQSQLDRRRRDVRKWYELIQVKCKGGPRYQLGERKKDAGRSQKINGRLRAEVLRIAGGRCQMCGRTIAEDGIKLQVDHKIPEDWGGTNDLENLWALCEECNHGKKNHFASQDDAIRPLMKLESVHVRIGELLKLKLNQWVPAQTIQFVAGQDDWKKRTRDLRYLGWKIDVTTKRQPSGRVSSLYKLTTFSPWPPDPTKWIREYEKTRAKRRRDEADG